MRMLPLPLFLLFAFNPTSLRAQECEVAFPQQPLATTHVASCGLCVGLHSGWSISRHHHSGVVATHDSSQCRLEIFRLEEVGLTEVVALHERLYWGANTLSESCRASLAKSLNRDAHALHLGAYEPRLFGNRTWVVVRPGTNGTLELVQVRCPRHKPQVFSWSWLLQTVQSISWGGKASCSDG